MYLNIVIINSTKVDLVFCIVSFNLRVIIDDGNIIEFESHMLLNSVNLCYEF